MAAAKTKSKTLTCYVHVAHPDTGEIQIFGPDDEVPAWAVKAITNPDVWDDGETAESDAAGDEA